MKNVYRLSDFKCCHVKNEYPLFRTQEFLNKFDFVIHLIKFDLTTKYYLIKIIDVDIFKAIFNVRLKKIRIYYYVF